jgi:hypothetical protein
MRYRKIVSLSLIAACLLCAGVASAQTSRAASAASYIKRGNEWLVKGEIKRAIADWLSVLSS